MKLNRREFVTVLGLSGSVVPFLSAEEACHPTTPDILGPFFQPDAPFRTQVALPGEPGNPLRVYGTISDCGRPLGDALIEVWQANAEGCYSVNENCGVIPDSPEKYRLRARLKTDASGTYGLQTIKPAPYSVGAGRSRPSHIHYRVTLPESDGHSATELITQLYFQGDPYLESDPLSSRPEAASRIIALESGPEGKILQGRFDIVLSLAEIRADRTWGADIMVKKQPGRVTIYLPEEPEASYLFVYDTTGSLIGEAERKDGILEWRPPQSTTGTCLVKLLTEQGEIEEAFHLSI